jgi:hypothetical protein
MILRQSTGIDVRVGPFVDSTDGVTPETSVALGTADQAELLKADGAATVDISSATWAAVTGSDGWYDLTLTTSHTDTVGELVVVIQDSDLCLPVFAKFQVVEEAIYDAIWAASATRIPADVTAISGTTAVADNLEASLETMLTGTATGGSTSTVTSAVTGHGNDTFIGRVLIFRTGTLQYEAGVITDYDSTSGTFTFAAATFTTSPTTETFVIV